MAYRVELTARAISDMVAIYTFISAGTSAAANEWFNGLEKAIFSLDQLPGRGLITRDRPPLRHLLYGNKPHIYRIIYSINERLKRVNVVTVRHGAQRPLNR